MKNRLRWLGAFVMGSLAVSFLMTAAFLHSYSTGHLSGHLPWSSLVELVSVTALSMSSYGIPVGVFVAATLDRNSRRNADGRIVRSRLVRTMGTGLILALLGFVLAADVLPRISNYESSLLWQLTMVKPGGFRPLDPQSFKGGIHGTTYSELGVEMDSLNTRMEKRRLELVEFMRANVSNDSLNALQNDRLLNVLGMTLSELQHRDAEQEYEVHWSNKEMRAFLTPRRWPSIPGDLNVSALKRKGQKC